MVALGLILSMALSTAACSSGGGSAESKGTEAAAPAETTAKAAEDTAAGESSEAADNAGGDLKTGVKVTLIPKIRQEAFWNAVEAGAQAAADKLQAKLTIQGDPSGSNTAAKQATYVEAAMEKGEEAICFAALDSNTTDAALQAAMKAGVTAVSYTHLDVYKRQRSWRRRLTGNTILTLWRASCLVWEANPTYRVPMSSIPTMC